MAWELTDRNKELKQSLDLKDAFSKTRFTEKKDLVMLRQKFALELLGARDKVAEKRHKERLQVLDTKFKHDIN